MVAERTSGGRDLDSEGLADGAEGFVDLADVGAMVGVGEFADGGFADAEAAGEFDLGDSLVAHGRVEGELGRNDGWDGNERLTRQGLAGFRDVPLLVDVAGEGGGEGILGQGQSFGRVCAAGDGFRDVGKGGDEAAVFVGRKVTGVCVDDGSEVLSVDVQLPEHGGQQSPGQFALLDGGETRSDVESSVAALAAGRIEAEVLTCVAGLPPCPPDEFAAGHCGRFAPLSAIDKGDGRERRGRRSRITRRSRQGFGLCRRFRGGGWGGLGWS